MTTLTTDPGATAAAGNDPEGGDDITIIPDPEPSQARPIASGGLSMSARKIWTLVAVWVAVVLACFGLVIYGLEPMFTARQQSDLLESYRAVLAHATAEAQGLPGVSTPTKAVEYGSPVGIMEVNALHLQQVVVEGAGVSQTSVGPGHVAGTAAPGQPGNSVVVGRRTAYGGPFHDLDQLGPDDAILVTTTQGQVVYKVSSVDEMVIGSPPTAGASTTTAAAAAETGEDGSNRTTLDDLYGATKDDRLTLVTSDSPVPWNVTHATVVVAIMDGLPFAPTPQNGRTDTSTRISGSWSAWAPLALALAGFAAAAVAAVWLYRRSSARIAYMLTTPPLIVFAILLAEAISKMLPTWT